MAEENSVKAEDTPQEQTTVTEKVTDNDLSSAWDATQETQETEPENKGEENQTEGEVKEEQNVEDNIPDEPVDNAERSKLGRRLKTIEEKFDSFLTKLEQGGNQQVQQEQKVPVNVTYDNKFIQSQLDAAVERGELPATIVTPNDQFLVNSFINNIQTQIGNQYAVNYINTLKAPSLKGNTPDDIHAEVVAELQKVESPFNLRRYDNPVVDAQMNYLEAKNHILQTRLANGVQTPNVFKGKLKGSPPTGTSVNTRTTTVVNDIPELDEASQDFIKRTGMSMDSVKAALKEPMPLHLGGRKK